MANPVIRDGAVDEYHVYLYGKSDNDIRPQELQSVPHVLWERKYFGELRINDYLKVINAIKATFSAKGVDEKYILNSHEILYGDEEEEFLYLTKYGNEVPDRAKNVLLPLNIQNAAAINSDFTEYAVVIWTRLFSLPVEEIIVRRGVNYQAGVGVPAEPAAAAGGRRKKTRRVNSSSKKRRSTRRRANRKH